jgi:hypothetical protein
MNHDSTDLRLDAARRFRQEFAALAVADADDLVRALSLAARLSLLGDAAPLAAWPKLAQGRVDALEAIDARAAELERELLEGEGEFLGLAVCLVQDLRVAVEGDPHGFLQARSEAILRLAELADEIPLDDEAAAVVAGYAELIPVPAEVRLGQVAHPLGLGAIAAVAAGGTPTRPIQRLARREPVANAAEIAEEELALCAGVAPAESLRRRFEERHAAMGTLEGGDHLAAWARLREDWSMVISLRIRPKDGPAGGARPLRPVAVRVGTRIAEPDEEADGMFLVELSSLSPDARSRLLVDPIVVTLSDGRRVSF